MPLLGALVGASFFVWIAGARILSPISVLWTLKSDWRVHFLGWHLFRHEPWQWPPGRLDGYYAPIGTAVGLTDSIPLAAFVAKPFDAWLPPEFQYLGLWMLLCFALQGLFGVLLVRIWSPDRPVQLLGAALFVLVPTLLNRVAHPALCSHWLLLWALWAALRDERRRPLPAEAVAMGLLAGLIHPYLTAMMLPLVAAPALGGRGTPRVAILATAGLATVAAVAGWYLSGIFSSTGTATMASAGLGYFSLNLLAPITPSGWSTLLPEQAVATPGQSFEGLQYLGAGGLALMVAAVAVRLVPRRPDAPRRAWAGLAVAAAAMAVFALSPKVTLGSALLVDLSGPWAGWMAIFRATSRFFWPATYLLLAAALASVGARLRGAPAAGVLAAAVVLQAVDLRDVHAERRAVARDDAFHAFDRQFLAEAWAQALPGYRHLVLYPPAQCATPPVAFEPAALLAGHYGLTINAGQVARYDLGREREYCHDLGDAVKQGRLADDAIYLMTAADADALRTTAGESVHCGELDRVSVCVTAASAAARWPGHVLR
jgi:hypothetical protein